MARKIQFKRGLKKNLPTLSPAEMAYTTDEKSAYIGDGAENIRLLDQKDKGELTAALADTVKEVNGVKPTNGKVTLPIPQVDTTNLRTKTEKLKLEDMSPETLAAIEGGEGTSFNLLSIPQDKSVTPDKTTFLNKVILSTNLYDKTKTSVGKLINYSNGAMSDNGTYSTTDFIPVTAGKTYTHKSNGYVNFYDVNKTWISGLSSSIPFTVPSGIAYARVTVLTSEIDVEMIVEGSVYPGVYMPYNEGVKSEQLRIEESNCSFLTPNNGKYAIKDTVNIIPANMPDVLTRSSTNLVDLTKIIKGKIPNLTTGELANSGVNAASDFIPVTPGKTYTQSETNNKVFYDSDKKFISGVSTKSAVAPANASFIRVGIYETNYQKAQLNEGASQLPYEDYYKYKINDNLKINKNVSSKIWDVLGDSITFGLNATKPYHAAIAERTGILVRNHGISGSTIAAPGSNPMSVRYANMPNDGDILTVLAGTNDFGDSIPLGALGDSTNTTFYGALKVLIEGLITKYPSKRIGFITPLPRTGHTSPNSGLASYVNAIKEMCSRYSIPVLDLYKGSGIAPDFPVSKNANIPDGLHPNDAGHLLISYKIENFINSI